MTVSRPADNQTADAYERLAAMDPPAMRSLIVELLRIADESAAAALREGTSEAAATADRDAQRAAAAQAALASASATAEPWSN